MCKNATENSRKTEWTQVNSIDSIFTRRTEMEDKQRDLRSSQLEQRRKQAEVIEQVLWYHVEAQSWDKPPLMVAATECRDEDGENHFSDWKREKKCDELHVVVILIQLKIEGKNN